jgi:hypothetical protein
MFTGAAQEYFEKDSKGQPQEPEKRFWRPTAEERRKLIMPFVWGEVATRQIFKTCIEQPVTLTNGLWFSHSLQRDVCRAPDPRVDSNRKVPNPNDGPRMANGRPAFKGKVRVRRMGRPAV